MPVAVASPQHNAVSDATGAGAATKPLRVVRLPIYPGASQRHLRWYTVHLHASDGWEIGSARFAALVSLPHVTAWYAAHMRAAGYVPESRETVHGGRERVPGWYVLPSTPGLTVQVDFARSGRKPALVWISYHVVDTPMPFRPTDTLISLDAERVLIRYRAASDVKKGALQLRTVAASDRLRQLIDAINQLQVDTRLRVQGEAGLYGGAQLVFSEPGGITQRVEVEFARNQVWVDGVPLFDPGDSVWLIVSRDMGQRPYPTA